MGSKCGAKLDRAKTDSKRAEMQLLHCVIDNTLLAQACLPMLILLGESERVEQDSRALRDLLNLACADAGCADPHPAASALHQRANRLQIQVPATLSYVMGVTDPVAELGSPATNFANSCHKTEISLYFEERLYQCAHVPGKLPYWVI